MPKFMYLYDGPEPDMSKMSREEVKAEMEKWSIWMKQVGSALKDPGNPMGSGAAVKGDGTEGPQPQINGYSIVEAADLDEAKKFTKNHPFLSSGTGEFSIQVCQIFPTPEDF